MKVTFENSTFCESKSILEPMLKSRKNVNWYLTSKPRKINLNNDIRNSKLYRSKYTLVSQITIVIIISR